MMKRVLAVIFSLMLFMTAGCGPEQQGKDTKLSKLTIGLMPDTDSIPFIIAAERGYFAEEGGEVELVPFMSAMERDAALQSGNLDGAVSDLLAVIFARSGGFSMHAVSYTDGNYNLVAGGNAGISAAADLRGKDIAISRNTIIEYVTDEILSVNGMKEQDVSKVVIPQIPVAVASGSRYVTGSGDLGINPGVIVFTDSSINEKAQSIRAMYRAYNKAVKYLNDTPRAEYIDLVMEKSGFPAPARDALDLKPYRSAGLPAEKDVEEAVRWVKSKELGGDYSYDDLVSKLLTEEK